jgi:hypothetical protein
MERDDLALHLYEFYLAHRNNIKQMAKYCPFVDVGTGIKCVDLCYQFEKLETGDNDCPCFAFGVEDAFTRLSETLSDEGYIV